MRVNTTRLFCARRLFPPCTFPTPEGNKVEACALWIEHEAIADAYDVITFEDFGNGQTKLTFIGNETMESAKIAGK